MQIPNFVVIGAMRAGTTTLYELMRREGQISVPRIKETDFFMTERNYARGMDWFLKQFDDTDRPLCDYSANYTRRDIFGEAASRIFETNPNAKIIYLVRDPMERAYSQFRHMTATGFEMPAPEDLPDHKQGKAIISGSSYAYQIEAYLEHFSIEDIIIIDFDDLIKSQLDTMSDLYARVGLQPPQLDVSTDIKANSSKELQRMPTFWGQFRRTGAGEFLRRRLPRPILNLLKKVVGRIAGSVSRSPKQAEFGPDVDAFLRDNLRSDIERFRQLTGRPFEHWSV